MSIDVVKFCTTHGVPEEDGTIKLGHREFCSKCLAEKLIAIGVHEVTMERFEREGHQVTEMTLCECCGGERPHTQNACPICGHQPPKDP